MVAMATFFILVVTYLANSQVSVYRTNGPLVFSSFSLSVARTFCTQPFKTDSNGIDVTASY